MGGFFVSKTKLSNPPKRIQSKPSPKNNPRSLNVKREKIIQASRDCAGQLGRSPSLRELLRLKCISEQNLQAECDFTNMPFSKRYQHWTLVPAAVRKFVEKETLQSKWRMCWRWWKRGLKEVDTSRVRFRRGRRRSAL